MNKEKPGCGYCPRTGHTWDDGAGKRICFACLRQQRLHYHDLAARQAEELAVLRDQVAAGNQGLKDAMAAGDLSIAHVAGQHRDAQEANRALRHQRDSYKAEAERLTAALAAHSQADSPALSPEPPAGLRSDLLALHETTGQMLAKLPAGREEESQA